MSRVAWQMPDGGLADFDLKRFWDKVDRRASGEGQLEHWLWTGSLVPAAAILLKGKSVSAVRIAWALSNPTELVPLRLYKLKERCGDITCINPACHSGLSVSRAAPLWQPTADKGEADARRPSEWQIPRAVEAYAALQFGLPVTPRPLFKSKVPIVSTIETQEGPTFVEPAVGTRQYTPNLGDLREAPELTAQQILDVIFQPDTVVMTFKTGHVWIRTPTVRLQADSGEEAILGVLVMSGHHKVKG